MSEAFFERSQRKRHTESIMNDQLVDAYHQLDVRRECEHNVTGLRSTAANILSQDRGCDETDKQHHQLGRHDKAQCRRTKACPARQQQITLLPHHT